MLVNVLYAGREYLVSSVMLPDFIRLPDMGYVFIEEMHRVSALAALQDFRNQPRTHDRAREEQCYKERHDRLLKCAHSSVWSLIQFTVATMARFVEQSGGIVDQMTRGYIEHTVHTVLMDLKAQSLVHSASFNHVRNPYDEPWRASLHFVMLLRLSNDFTDLKIVFQV